MKKFVVFISILILTPVIAAVYGLIHDQFTYTVSSEYYTAFKFVQFGLHPANVTYTHESPRLLVSLVGILATWWVGLPIGLLLGITGMIHQKPFDMFKITMKAVLIVMLIALVIGLVGLLYGYLFLDPVKLNWWIPENVTNVKRFVAVGSMHNFSYFGGAVGALCGIVYSIKNRKAVIDV